MAHSHQFQTEYKRNALVILQSDLTMIQKHDALMTLNAQLIALYDQGE